MRLRVSPFATSTPTGIFTQRFEALFPRAGALCCAVCSASLLFLPVYLCVNVGPRGLLAVTLPAPFVSQSAKSLSPATLPQLASAVAAHLRPTYQSGRMFCLHLLGCQTSMRFDFLSVLVVFFILNCFLLLVVRGGAMCLPMPPSWFPQILIDHRDMGLFP